MGYGVAPNIHKLCFIEIESVIYAHIAFHASVLSDLRMSPHTSRAWIWYMCNVFCGWFSQS